MSLSYSLLTHMTSIRMHYKAKHTKNPQHWQNYRDLRNKVISLIRKYVDEYRIKLTAKIDKNIPPGKWWRIVTYVNHFPN